MKLVEEDQIDIICIQEPYTYQRKVAGIPKTYKIYNTSEIKCRAAVVATNSSIRGLLEKYPTVFFYANT